MNGFDVLRIAAAMCFIGHGAFGILTKAGWLPYFAVVGIGPQLGYRFMPIIGVVDILLGLSMLRPTKAAVAYMTVWAVWTALLRPLAGQGVAEALERAGNYGVPLALLFVGLQQRPAGGWFATMANVTLDARTARRVRWTLRVSTALLLLGHGLLALSGKPLLVKHLAVLGLSPTTLVAQGWFEIDLAVAVVALPVAPLLILACLWKVATELIFPASGDYWWEFVERGGSYGAPLALLLLGRYNSRS